MILASWLFTVDFWNSKLIHFLIHFPQMLKYNFLIIDTVFILKLYMFKNDSSELNLK